MFAFQTTAEFAIRLAARIDAAHPSQLDQLSRTLWHGYGRGLIADEEAQRLAEVIHARRQLSRSTALTPPLLRAGRFTPRKEPPVRRHTERITRRRSLAAGAPLPPVMASAWTTGELAVLRIVGDEAREGGVCALSLAEIAARAGVCRTLARTTLRHAARVGLVTIEERPRSGAKNLTNLVRILSPEWRTWLERGPKRRDMAEAGGLVRTELGVAGLGEARAAGIEAAGIGGRNLPPTDTSLLSKGRKTVKSQERLGFSGRRRPHEPPSTPR